MTFSRVAAFTPIAASLSTVEAQTSYSILRIELVNATLYTSGYCGVSDQYKNANKLPTPPVGGGFGLADIISVNGQAVEGTAIETIATLLERSLQAFTSRESEAARRLLGLQKKSLPRELVLR